MGWQPAVGERRAVHFAKNGIIVFDKYCYRKHETKKETGCYIRCYCYRRDAIDAQQFLKDYQKLPCTPRMVQAMQLLALGCTLDQVALEMGISIKVVNRHLSRARRRLGAETRPEMIARAVALGLVLVDFKKKKTLTNQVT
jgi:DNA-binding CsgD family transcriptional regulator